MNRFITGVVAGTFAVGAVVAPWGAVPAMADSNVDPVGWHISELGYDQLHTEGYTGEGLTIAVVEPGFDPDSPDLAGANVEWVPLPEECRFATPTTEEVGHGTNVVSVIAGQGGNGLIQGVAPDARVLVMETPSSQYTPASDEWPANCDGELATLGGRAMAADELGADIISLSTIGGAEPHDYEVTYFLMNQLGYFVGAGNQGFVASVSAPVQGTGVVGAAGPGGEVPEWSGQGQDISLVAPGVDIPNRDPISGELVSAEGTSFSAPITAGTLALGMQAWPEATTHQLTQSLARNSAGSNQDLTHNEESGYGMIDPATFIATDPTQYPDEPPFMEEKSWYDPSWESVRRLFEGFPDNAVTGHSQNYEMDAGINPDVIEWIPEGLDQHIGIAPNFAYWETAGGSEEPMQLEHDELVPVPETEGSEIVPGVSAVNTAIGAIIFGMIALVILAAVVVLIIVLVRRSRKTSPSANAGGYGQYPGAEPYGQPGAHWQSGTPSHQHYPGHTGPHAQPGHYYGPPDGATNVPATPPAPSDHGPQDHAEPRHDPPQ